MLNKINLFYLEVVVFICGASVMVFELVGSRLLAPFVGTSIFVWTSLVGVILASLSIGYFLGGKMADTKADRKTLSLVIFFSGLLIALTATINSFVLKYLTWLIHDIRASSFIALLLLFAPANILLGVVSPYTAKLKMKDLGHTGRVFGNLYAVSTAGSIVGTFVTGYWLITLLGSTVILYVISVLLIACSALALGRVSSQNIYLSIIILSVMVSQILQKEMLSKNGFVDLDTSYQRVQIIDMEKDGRPVRLLQTDVFGIQSGQYRDSNELLYEYTKMYDLALFFRPNPKKILMIGGGAFSYPKYFLEKYPESSMDVIEIDPSLTRLAKEYFGLKEDPRLKIYHEDGRTYLNRNTKSYDAILIDAFHSLTPPFQLSTVEAVKRMRDNLDPNGVVILNIIGSIEGKNGKFIRAEYQTYRKIFANVELFPVSDHEDGSLSQNIILVASRSSNFSLQNSDQRFEKSLKKRWAKPIVLDTAELTDEHAPVEQYLSSMYSGF